MKVVRKLFSILSNAEKKELGLLVLLVVGMAFLDVIGIASIMPFMTILINQSLVTENPFVNEIYLNAQKIGIDNVSEFLITLGFAVLFIFVFSIIYRAITLYLQTRFVLTKECSIAGRLLESNLQQPYGWFLKKHSSDLGKNILSEVEMVVHGVLAPFISLVTYSLVSLAVLSLLIYVDPFLAMVVGGVLSSAFVIVFWSTRSYLAKIGKQRVVANNDRFRAINNVFGAIKEVKFGGFENTYLAKFIGPAFTYANLNVNAQFIGQLPKYFLEMFAFGGILLLVIYNMAIAGGGGDAIALVALYAVAGYRLMPALQQIYLATTRIRFALPALDVLYSNLGSHHYIHEECRDAVVFEREISFKEISFIYPGSKNKSLDEFSISILKGEKVGLAGPSGSGKTTTIDILLGLLQANSGGLYVDGSIVNLEKAQAWKKLIGYVPQEIYLSDDTLAANIAFGVEKDAIDMEAVFKAAKVANINSFVESLPLKYETPLGERGVRFSGGQRQRIGIARALYHDPQILILDEATSALDTISEKAIIDAMGNLGKDKTIILIAHRLELLKNCDRIILIKDGKLHGSGSYEELVRSNPLFKEMAST